MNVLITGGFGFLGGRLGRHLHGLGLNTYLATRYSKNKPKWLKNGGVLKVDWANTSALFNELPEIDILIIEDADHTAPNGIKGLGEHVLIPTAPAILNGIRNATGAKINQLPATPARVLTAIKDVKLRSA